jgi:hypothetical protein
MAQGTNIRQPKFATFEGASDQDERLGAILIAKDATTGKVKVHVTVPEGRSLPAPEAIDMIGAAFEIANL